MQEAQDEAAAKAWWYRSPWLIPVAGLCVIVVVNAVSGATAVVRVAAIAVALAVAVIAAPSIEGPRHRAIFVAAVLVALAAALAVLDRQSVHRALEPKTGSFSHTAANRSPAQRSFRGMIVRPEQVAAHDLTRVDFSGATLDGLNLRRRRFDGDHLEGASLAGADLRGARLQDAHLEGAVLRGASLSNACLLDAHLEGADVSGASFGGADVTGVFGAAAARRTAASWPTRPALSDVCR